MNEELKLDPQSIDGDDDIHSAGGGMSAGLLHHCHPKLTDKFKELEYANEMHRIASEKAMDAKKVMDDAQRWFNDRFCKLNTKEDNQPFESLDDVAELAEPTEPSPEGELDPDPDPGYSSDDHLKDALLSEILAGKASAVAPRLHDQDIQTLGELQAYLACGHLLSDIPGISKARVSVIESAIDEYRKKRKGVA